MIKDSVIDSTVVDITGGSLDAQALIAKVRDYNPSADLELLNLATKFCERKHNKQIRASGEPYSTHPIAVAHILADRKLDMDSVITGLLHDVIEDTDTQANEIAVKFSDDIARMVDGVTKLTDLEKGYLAQNVESGVASKAFEQAINYRKMFLAISKDVRVLIVKIADRLHNMRTLDYISKQHRRERIARETLLVYAPLAERIGIYAWKNELQDLAFRELNGRAYGEIVAHLKKIQGDEKHLASIRERLNSLLSSGGINSEVTSRLKNPASIWQKMERRGIALQELVDIMAFRIFVDDEEQCYRALGIIHGEYKALFNGFRDYISTPKHNGYRSLHTAVSTSDGDLIEIQIRTHEMHEHSENGIASHWRYKSGSMISNDKEIRKDPHQLGWLRDIMERLERLEDDPETAMRSAQLDLYQDQVFCFTPRHDVIALRTGAVVLDFAYAVHSEIGHKCTGGRVNGRARPLNYVLENGDRVEIITSETQTPHVSWKEVAQTHTARSALRHYFNIRHRRQKVALGRERVEKFFKTVGASLTDKVLESALLKLGEDGNLPSQILSIDDLYYSVSLNRSDPEDILYAAYPGRDEKLRSRYRVKSGAQKFISGVMKHLYSDSSGSLIVNHPDTHFAINFGRCCHPVPGDKIVGIKTIGLGMTVHRLDCLGLQNVISMQDRWVDVTWSSEYYGNRDYVGRLEVILENNPGSLGKACAIIGSQGVNIDNLKFSERVSDFYVMIFDLDVRDLSKLRDIIKSLRACPEVNKVVRT